MEASNQQFLRKRKMMVALPLLVIPFLTLFFWALGGGSAAANSQGTNRSSGFNMQFPLPELSNKPMDKLSLYEQAEKDSDALNEQRKQDPFYADDTETTKVADKQTMSTVANNAANKYHQKNIIPSSGGINLAPTDQAPDEEKIDRKLAELKKALATEQKTVAAPDSQQTMVTTLPLDQDDPVLSQLQQQMQSMDQQGSSDPELNQLDGMLNKILDIEHPERIDQQLKTQSEKERGRVFPVATTAELPDIALMNQKQPSIRYTATKVVRPEADSLAATTNIATVSTQVHNRFYGLDDESSVNSDQQDKAITAVVHQTQTLVSGATVKMRLTQNIYINGQTIPSGTFVYGNCTLDGERLNIDIKTIRYHNELFPVSLKVYDLDGIEGIDVPGAIIRNVMKQNAGQSLQEMNMLNMNPSLGAQAASAGIQAAQSLFSAKTRLVRVTVKAGYPILLMDTHNRQQ